MKNGKLVPLVMALTITGSAFAHQFDFAVISNWNVYKLEKITDNDRIVKKFGADSCRAYLDVNKKISKKTLTQVIPGKDIDHLWQNGLIVDSNICQKMAEEMVGDHELDVAWDSIEHDNIKDRTIITLKNGENTIFSGLNFSLYNGYIFEDNEGDIYPERY